MKITVTYEAELDKTEMRVADELNAGESMDDIARKLGMPKKKVIALKGKIYRKLFIKDPLSLYKLTHSDCPHCGKALEQVPLALRK